MKTITATDLRSATGKTIVDVREYPEFAGGAISGARLVPLGNVEKIVADWSRKQTMVLVCRSGKRATQAGELLERLGFQNVSVLEGGMEAWRKSGFPVATATKRPWALERQVRVIAGSLVLVSAILGLTVSPWFFGLTLFVGAGLVFAGVTDVCMMAKLLGKMPWNQMPDHELKS